MFGLFVLLLLPFLCNAQLQIEGYVVNTQNQPIPGAIAKIHELRTGSTTNFDGYFNIKNLNRGNYHLHFTAIGYHALTIDTSIND